MTQYASKSPRDLNHDRTPYVAPDGTRRTFRHEALGIVEHNPRPEFDHVQHNEPNPILLDFRKSGKSATEYQYHAMLYGYPSVYHFEIEHARKVLSRLSRLEQK